MFAGSRLCPRFLGAGVVELARFQGSELPQGRSRSGCEAGGGERKGRGVYGAIHTATMEGRTGAPLLLRALGMCLAYLSVNPALPILTQNYHLLHRLMWQILPKADRV